MGRLESASKDTMATIPDDERRPFWITRPMAEKYGREAVLRTTLIETGIYLLFLIVVLIATLGSHSSSMYYLTRAMQKQFVEMPFRTKNDIEITFDDIKSVDDFWNYGETIFTEAFNWDTWYGTTQATSEDDKKVLYENKLLGVPRIRQLRVRDDSCSIHEYFAAQFFKCYGAYTWKNQEVGSFGNATGTAWTYSSPEDLAGTTFTGKLATYYAGGYYEDLSSDHNIIKEQILNLKSSLWITRGTRAVFIDFTVYNANLNLFAMCKLLFEFPPTGGIIPSSHIQTLHVLSGGTFLEGMVVGMTWLLLIFALYYAAEEIREGLYFQLKYFTMFWSYIDITLIILIFTMVICNIMRSSAASNLETLIASEHVYANFEPLTDAYITYNNITAIVAFFSFIKLFKYLSINKTMGQLNNTLRNCAMDILGFSVMFFIIFFAFAELGYLLFGSKVESFSTFGTSMFTLLRTILGDFDYMEIEQANRVLAPIFFLSYIFFVFFVLLNMFLAIINDTYADVKAEIAAAPTEMQLTHYIRNLFGKFFAKKQTPEEEDEESKIEDAMIKKIRQTLLQLGFTEPQIEMFLERYNIDINAEIDDYEVKRILQDLGKEADDGLPVVRIVDFLEQQQRLRGVERSVRDLSKLTNRLIKKLEHVHKVNKESVDQPN